MPDDIAIKLLRQSDLTLFDPIWQRENEHLRLGLKDKISKQKAINLNAREFLDKLYPGVRDTALAGTTRIPLALTIYGPNGAGPHEIARKAVRSPGSKNWRLNGETIHDPEGEPGRYSGLREGDLALMRFEGEPQPTGLTIALISADTDQDQLFWELKRWVDGTGMVLLTRAELANTLKSALVPDDNFLWQLAYDEETEGALEQNAEGDDRALSRLRPRRGRVGGGVSLDQWLRARAAAEATGRAGEEMVAKWLSNREISFDWVSMNAPLSPFDMLIDNLELSTAPTYVDVKTTKGGFETRFHLSMGEASFAASCDANEPYRIIRVFDAETPTPAFRISSPINAWALNFFEVGTASLPAGIYPDGLIVDPHEAGIIWGPVHLIEDDQDE